MRSMKASDAYRAARTRVDSFVNTITGIGTSLDKATRGFFASPTILTGDELDDLFNGDDLAHKAIVKIVEDGLRGGYTLTISPDDDSDLEDANEQAAAVASYLDDDLGALDALGEGWTWGRLFGGGAIYIVTDGGGDDQATALDEASIVRVVALTVVEKRDLWVSSVYSDPAHPRFGRPETYSVTMADGAGVGSTGMVSIHESRLILFGGAMTTPRQRNKQHGWDLSELQRGYDILMACNMSFQSLSNILQDASQGIFKMEGMIDMIASGGREDVQTRMSLVDLQRSNARSLVIDAEKESFERLSPSLTGYPEALRLLMIRLAGAVDMPLTVLFGTSPSGLNATGESDRVLWAQTVEAERAKVADRALTRLARLVMLSREGPTRGVLPERWNVEFPALISMTEKEVEETRKLVADRDAIYAREGILTPEEIAINRFGSEGWSAETVIDTTERQLILTEGSMPPDDSGEDDDPAPEPDDEASGDSGKDPIIDKDTALNGAQVTALKAIVSDVAAGVIPRDTGIELIIAAFPLDLAEAEKIMGSVGKGFVAPE